MRASHRCLGAVAVCAALTAAGEAHADTFAARAGSVARVLRTDVLLLEQPESTSYEVVERLTVRHDQAQTVWLRPFRARPRVAAGPGSDLFAALGRHAVRRPAHSDALRSQPFGPSLVTLIAHRLDPDPVVGPSLDTASAGRSLQVDAVEIIQGPARTSSVTGAVTLPSTLEELLRRRDVRLGATERRALGRYLDEGWWILAMALYDPAPTTEGPATLGPFAFTFEGTRPEYPLLRRTAADETSFAFHVVGTSPSVPDGLPVTTVEPGAEAPAGTAALRFAGPVSPELAFTLREGHGLPVAAGLIHTHTDFQPGGAELEWTRFVPPDQAQGRPTPPPPTGRGGGRDLLLCLLLGFAPLVLAPESWLLAWVQSRARAAARAGGPRFGVRVWVVWPLVVGTYWLLMLDDLARVAAIGPFLVGAALLAFPYTGRDPAPVRAQLSKRLRVAVDPRRPAEAPPAREPGA